MWDIPEYGLLYQHVSFGSNVANIQSKELFPAELPHIPLF